MYGVNGESDIEEDDVETEADLLEGDIAVPEVKYFLFHIKMLFGSKNL